MSPNFFLLVKIWVCHLHYYRAGESNQVLHANPPKNLKSALGNSIWSSSPSVPRQLDLVSLSEGHLSKRGTLQRLAKGCLPFILFILLFQSLFVLARSAHGLCVEVRGQPRCQSPTPSPLPDFLVVPVHTKLVGPPASADSLVSASHLFVEDTGQRLALHGF